MKEFWNKYRTFIIALLLITVFYVYHNYTVKKYERELYQKEVEFIIEKDRMKEEMLKKRASEIDSLLRLEKVRYDSLVTIINKTKKEYEKIRNNYSDIIIDRPKF